MTTIAWDGTTLAGDTQASAIIKRLVDKVFYIKENTYFGGAGTYENCLQVRDWLILGGEKPVLEDNFSGLIIQDGIAYRIEQKLMRSKIQESHHAIGSGSPYAMMAMHLGKTAEESVRLASLFDTDTNYEIMVFNCLIR